MSKILLDPASWHWDRAPLDWGCQSHASPMTGSIQQPLSDRERPPLWLVPASSPWVTGRGLPHDRFQPAVPEWQGEASPMTGSYQQSLSDRERPPPWQVPASSPWVTERGLPHDRFQPAVPEWLREASPMTGSSQQSLSDWERPPPWQVPASSPWVTRRGLPHDRFLPAVPGWQEEGSPMTGSSQQSLNDGEKPPQDRFQAASWPEGLGLGLQGLYSTTNCAGNILGCFTIILQNQIARVDSFTNLTKRWVFRFRLNASNSSHNLISFGKQLHARGPYTANARLQKVSCLNF